MSFSQRDYDIVIAGTGCSGLSLAWHILSHPSLKDRNVAIIDAGENEPPIDKTWCFWHKDYVPEPVPIAKSWSTLEIFAGSYEKREKPGELTYNCVRSEEYTREMTAAVKSFSNLDWHHGPVTGAADTGRSVKVNTLNGDITASHYFKCYGNADMSRSEYKLLQHFKGIEIETRKPVFDPEVARFMDFRTEQRDGATFFYVLPYSEKKALVEYTLFSPAVLELQEYDKAIDEYITLHLGLQKGDYTAGRAEFGVIPMADRIWNPGKSPRIHYAGTPSGVPKASTGYAFSRIHRQAHALAGQLAAGDKIETPPASSRRFRMYDLVMLDVLSNNPGMGPDVFEDLFSKNPLERVLRFIDEKSTPAEDLKVMWSVPSGVFTEAALRKAGSLAGGVL